MSDKMKLGEFLFEIVEREGLNGSVIKDEVRVFKNDRPSCYFSSNTSSSLAVLKLLGFCKDLIAHLDYCGWGDSWEREVSEELRKAADEFMKGVKDA